jgi:hypothetical protein
MSFTGNLTGTQSSNSKQINVRGETSVILQSKDFLVADLRLAIAGMAPDTIITGIDHHTEDQIPSVTIHWKRIEHPMDMTPSPITREYIGDPKFGIDQTPKRMMTGVNNPYPNLTVDCVDHVKEVTYPVLDKEEK